MTAETALTPETLKSTHSTSLGTTVLWHAPARPQPSPSPIATAGFIVFCIYLLSGFANDWSLHLFGLKAYLSTVTLVLLPLAWFLSGNALRGFQTRAGRYWAAFLLWMLIAAPLSVWKGGSAHMILNYVPRAYFCFFYTCSFVTSPRRCRQLMYVQVASAVALLISCAAFGSPGGDIAGDPGNARFRIPGSLFYANSNDLALALLIGITSFLFLLTRPKIVPRLAGAAGILAAAFYAVQTGSRGSVIAAASLLAVLLWVSRAKWKVLALGFAALAVVGIATVAGAPSSTLHRFSLLLGDPAAATETQADLASLASEQQREHLFATSLRYTLAHPVFGVGPDQFAAAVEQDADRSGRHIPWLGTHNSYTQVSSECGIPALLFYAAVIVYCLRANYRLTMRTRGRPSQCEISALSRCLLAGTCVYAVSAFFFHMAYSAHLPMLAGFTAALQLASKPLPAPNSV